MDKKNYSVTFTGLSKVELIESEIPQVGAGEVLVELEASLISTGTELTQLEGNVEKGSPWENDIVFPRIPGYCGAGRIVAIGEGVDPALMGQRLVTGLLHHQKYTVLEEAKLADNVVFMSETDNAADCTFSTISCITMASIRVAAMRPGDTCLVYGAGIIGQMVARNARMAGASKVFVTDISDLRLSKLPDDPTFVPINGMKVNTVEAIQELTGGRGVDVVFETTSNPKLVEEQLKCLVVKGNGKLIITSSPKGKSLVDFDFCSRKGLTIIGAHNFAWHTPVAHVKDPWTRNADSCLFVELLAKKRFTVDEMITHTFHYRDAVSAYEMLMKDRTQALGVMLDWTEKA